MKYLLTILMISFCVGITAQDEPKNDKTIEEAEKKIQEAQKTIEEAQKKIKEAEKAKAEKRAYLGVYATVLSPALKSHLKIDVGLIIERVIKNGPAAKAGLEKYDVITAINDKIIEDGKPLSKMIEEFKPGETISLDIIRTGEDQSIKVELGTAAQRMSLADMKKRIMINPNEFKNGGNFGLDFGNNGNIRVEILNDMEDIRKQMEQINKLKIGQIDNDLQQMLERLAKRPQGPNNFKFKGMISSMIHINDGTHNIQIKTENGKKNAKITDKAGNLIYEGPINTKEELESLPADVREKIGKFKINKEFH